MAPMISRCKNCDQKIYLAKPSWGDAGWSHDSGFAGCADISGSYAEPKFKPKYKTPPTEQSDPHKDCTLYHCSQGTPFVCPNSIHCSQGTPFAVAKDKCANCGKKIHHVPAWGYNKWTHTDTASSQCEDDDVLSKAQAEPNHYHKGINDECHNCGEPIYRGWSNWFHQETNHHNCAGDETHSAKPTHNPDESNQTPAKRQASKVYYNSLIKAASASRILVTDPEAQYYQSHPPDENPKVTGAVTKQGSINHKQGAPSMNDEQPIQLQEARLLSAMAVATPDEQQMLMRDLESLRRTEASRIATEASIDLADEYVHDLLTPVMPHVSHSASTDWLGEVNLDVDDVQTRMLTAAALWYHKASPDLRADPREYMTQAHLQMARTASAMGEYRDLAYKTGMDHLAQINRIQSIAASENDSKCRAGNCDRKCYGNSVLCPEHGGSKKQANQEALLPWGVVLPPLPPSTPLGDNYNSNSNPAPGNPGQPQPLSNDAEHAPSGSGVSPGDLGAANVSSEWMPSQDMAPPGAGGSTQQSDSSVGQPNPNIVQGSWNDKSFDHPSSNHEENEGTAWWQDKMKDKDEPESKEDYLKSTGGALQFFAASNCAKCGNPIHPDSQGGWYHDVEGNDYQKNSELDRSHKPAPSKHTGALQFFADEASPQWDGFPYRPGASTNQTPQELAAASGPGSVGHQNYNMSPMPNPSQYGAQWSPYMSGLENSEDAGMSTQDNLAEPANMHPHTSNTQIRTASKSRNCTNGNHSDCKNCSCSCHSSAKGKSGACTGKSHGSCKMSGCTCSCHKSKTGAATKCADCGHYGNWKNCKCTAKGCTCSKSAPKQGSAAFNYARPTYAEYLARLSEGASPVSAEFYSGSLAAVSPRADAASWNGGRTAVAEHVHMPRIQSSVRTAKTAGNMSEDEMNKFRGAGAKELAGYKSTHPESMSDGELAAHLFKSHGLNSSGDRRSNLRWHDMDHLPGWSNGPRDHNHGELYKQSSAHHADFDDPTGSQIGSNPAAWLTNNHDQEAYAQSGNANSSLGDFPQGGQMAETFSNISDFPDTGPAEVSSERAPVVQQNKNGNADLQNVQGSWHFAAEDEDNDDDDQPNAQQPSTGFETGGNGAGGYQPDRSLNAQSPAGQAQNTHDYEDAYSSGAHIDWSGTGMDTLGIPPIDGYLHDAEHPNAEMWAWEMGPVGTPASGAADVANVATPGIISEQSTGASYPQPNIKQQANLKLAAFRETIAGAMDDSLGV